MISGGFATWAIARSEPWLDAGRPVELSTFGNVVFFLIGTPVGCITGVIAAAVYLRVCQHHPRVVVQCVVLATATGAIMSSAFLLTLAVSLVTMPRSWFDALTN